MAISEYKKIHITHKINKVFISKIYNNPLQIKEKWVRDLKEFIKEYMKMAHKHI